MNSIQTEVALRPPTYPARPMNGGHLDHALPKIGAWSYEPKYNGWRALLHIPTGQMWNRHGKPLTITGEFTPVLERLRNGIPTADPRWLEWLDVEALERRHNLGRGSLIVLDAPLHPGAYLERTNALFEYLINRHPTTRLADALHHSDRPEPDKIYMPYVYPESELPGLWARLQEMNRTLGCDFYEGVVSKKNDSRYPIQLRSAEQETPNWMKHRFVK